MKIDRDNCLRLQCEVKTNDHRASFLGYNFNFSYWMDYTTQSPNDKRVLKMDTY